MPTIWIVLQRKRHTEIELCISLRVLQLFRVGHLLSTNGFHAKAKKERLTAAGSRRRQNLKYENFTSFDHS